MTKTVSVNDFTYSELAVLAGRLSIIAKKPISLGMAISIATAALDAYLKFPGSEKSLEKELSDPSRKMMSPEEFESYWDEFFKAITEEKKK